MNFRSIHLLLALFTLALTACGGDATSKQPALHVPAALSDPNAEGEALVNAWFELISQTGSGEGILEVSPEEVKRAVELIKPHLDPAFQLQRATGQRDVRDNFIPSDIDAFVVSNVRVTEPRDDIKVVRYATQTPGATFPDTEMLMSDELAPRLSVVRWDKDLARWLIVSHANFNTPVQAILNQKSVTLDAEEVRTSAEDRALGEKLARTWFELLVAGDGSPLLHADVQGQTAGGAGYTTAGEYKKGHIKLAELSDFVVTRNDDLIVVTLGVHAEGTLFADSMELGTKKQPRMLTFLQNDQGEWKVISTATFNPPVALPSNIDPATSTK